MGKLANILKGVCNKLNDELNELLPEISAWAVKRNNTVHEMAKLQPDTYLPFAERYKALKQCAAEGKKLFVKTNSAIKRYRAAIKKGTITL